MDIDVLIVGAGPTGLMLANQLIRRGARILIIDRHAGPAVQTRALGVHARTLEIYDRLDIANEAIDLGTKATGANVWASGRHMARVPLGEAGSNLTPFPYILVLGQDDNERIMGDRLRGQGGSVQWNSELTGIEQRDGYVRATITTEGSRRYTVEAAWVAGCDGARSTVRELNSVGFPGAPYEHVFFVADTEATGTMVADEVNIYFWREGFHLFFPMRGRDHWRLVGILPEPLRDRDDASFEDVVPSLRQVAGPDLAFKSCSWFSTYRIHHRRAVRFRSDRCFLLGDAAHIHSPVGAQGMNTGLQDAHNLAWKLAAVIAGEAAEALLDSYEVERMPVAERLLATTDRAFRVVVSDSWIAGLLRTQVLARVAALAMGRARIQRAAFRVIAQLAIDYRASPLSKSTVKHAKRAPQAGDRFPWVMLQQDPSREAADLFSLLDDTRWTLLLLGSSDTNTVARIQSFASVRTLSFPKTLANERALGTVQIDMPSFFLLRPDGHIGFCGDECSEGELHRYFQERAYMRR